MHLFTFNSLKWVEWASGVSRKAVAAFTFSWMKKRDVAIAQEEHHLPKHKLVTKSLIRQGSRLKNDCKGVEAAQSHPSDAYCR